MEVWDGLALQRIDKTPLHTQAQFCTLCFSCVPGDLKWEYETVQFLQLGKNMVSAIPFWIGKLHRNVFE